MRPGLPPPPAERPPMEPRGAALHDAQAFIASLNEVDLSRFRVVGTYTQHGEVVRARRQFIRRPV